MDKETYEIKTKIIEELFDDKRAIKYCTPEDVRDVGEGIYEGGDVFTTEEEEFIDLELQLTDFDEDELIKYIEFAEALYEKHKKLVSIYIICPKSVEVHVNECTIPSDADFVIKLLRIDMDPCKIALQAIKNKIETSKAIDDEDVFAMSMLAMFCRPEERNYYLKEYLMTMNML